MAALEIVKCCRNSDVNMENGSTPGVVSACYDLLDGNWCWENVCLLQVGICPFCIFFFSDVREQHRKELNSSVWVDSLCVQAVLEVLLLGESLDHSMIQGFLWGMWKPASVSLCCHCEQSTAFFPLAQWCEKKQCKLIRWAAAKEEDCLQFYIVQDWMFVWSQTIHPSLHI